MNNLLPKELMNRSNSSGILSYGEQKLFIFLKLVEEFNNALFLRITDNIKKRVISIDHFTRNISDHLFLSIESISFISNLINNLQIEVAYSPNLSLDSPLLFANNIGSIIVPSDSKREYYNSIFCEKPKLIKYNRQQYDFLFIIPELMYDTYLEKNEIINFNVIDNEPHADYEVITSFSNILFNNKNQIQENGYIVSILNGRDIFTEKNQRIINDLGFIFCGVFTLNNQVNGLDRDRMTRYLVVLKKCLNKEPVFIAQINADKTLNTRVINNFINKKSDNEATGIVINSYDEIRPIAYYIAKNEFEKMFKGIGFEKVELSTICSSIKIIRRDDEDSEILPNSVYLSLIGIAKVVDSIEKLSEKTMKFAQISLDSQKISNLYFMLFLNSSLGIKLRETLLTGNSIRFITQQSLLQAKIVLPSLTTQNEMVRLTNQIEKHNILLNEMRSNLWTNYKLSDIKKIQKELDLYEDEDKLNLWLDSLPFPLASVLWHYESTKNTASKILNLLNFFESLSEFLSILLLSAYSSNQEFYESNKGKWLNDNVQNSDWYKHTTFGQWVSLYAKLSKVGRQMLNEEEESKEFLRSLFENSNDEFFNIFDKDLIQVLSATKDIRNANKGHGGITSDAQNQSILNELERHLNITKELLLNSFSDTVIILPIDGKKTKGVYNNRVYMLAGNKTPFREEYISLIDLLDTDKLYLYNKGKFSAIQLIPLVKIEVSTGACYFYSSVQSSKMRWISYHYTNASEIHTDYDKDIFKPFT